MSKASRELVKIHVQFTILTPDQLKQIVFGLNKDTGTNGTVSWKITFALSTRETKSGAFTNVVDTVVEADFKDNDLAEETASKGVNKPQSDHLTLNVATAGQRFKAGKIKKATLDRAVKGTLPARNG